MLPQQITHVKSAVLAIYRRLRFDRRYGSLVAAREFSRQRDMTAKRMDRRYGNKKVLLNTAPYLQVPFSDSLMQTPLSV